MCIPEDTTQHKILADDAQNIQGKALHNIVVVSMINSLCVLLECLVKPLICHNMCKCHSKNSCSIMDFIVWIPFKSRSHLE